MEIRINENTKSMTREFINVNKDYDCVTNYVCIRLVKDHGGHLLIGK